MNARIKRTVFPKPPLLLPCDCVTVGTAVVGTDVGTDCVNAFPGIVANSISCTTLNKLAMTLLSFTAMT